MRAPRLITPPAQLPVSLAEAKAHLRVDHDEEDMLIEAYLQAATAHLDGWSGTLGRAIVSQTWAQDYWSLGCAIALPVGPVASVTSVVYTDTAGVAQTLAPEAYRLIHETGGTAKIVPAIGVTWPVTAAFDGAVTVTYVAGVAVADVPPPVRTAILLMVGDFYRYRETVAVGTAITLPVAATVDRLLAPLRRWSL